jgi:lipopolysaccharide transport protein LptA
MALLALAGGGLRAQTNAPAVSAPTRAPTLITSDRADFDLTGHHAVYRGNVRVDDPQMKMTCEEMTVDLPQSGGHIDHLVALTNVVMDSVDDQGQPRHATSDKAVYDYKVVDGVTNETVTLTGHAKVEDKDGSMTGEPIVWDRANNSIHAENENMILRQSITTALVNTNTPTVKTNSSPAPKDLPLTKTNFPPGTIQNVDLITAPKTTTP